MTSDKDAEIAELKTTVAELEKRLAESKVIFQKMSGKNRKKESVEETPW